MIEIYAGVEPIIMCILKKCSILVCLSRDENRLLTHFVYAQCDTYENRLLAHFVYAQCDT